MTFEEITLIINGAVLLINLSFIVIYILTLRANLRMVSEAKLTRSEAYRPEVIAYIRQEDDLLFFQINNVGARPAFNIHLRVNQVFSNTELELQENNKFFKQVPNTTRDVQKDINLLAPSQSIETFLGDSTELISQQDAEGSPLELTYHDSEGNSYTENYIISLSDFESTEMYYNVRNEITKGLNGIEHQISKLVKKNE